MEEDPFNGDIVRLKAQSVAWRRRVGAWRILFDIESEKRRALVHDVARSLPLAGDGRSTDPS